MSHNLQLTGTVLPEFERILTPEALSFLAALEERFGERRQQLLQQRVTRPPP